MTKLVAAFSEAIGTIYDLIRHKIISMWDALPIMVTLTGMTISKKQLVVLAFRVKKNRCFSPVILCPVFAFLDMSDC
jgi:hypothetical protein